jgi:translation initiation factor IF-2
MSAVTSKVRIYDLAKDLKIDTKRLIEEVRREGVDVSVPSNSISKELAEKIRDKYFPKQSATVKRAVKIVKKAARPVVEEEAAPAEAEEIAAAAPPPAEPEPMPAQEEFVSPPQPVAPAQVVRRLAPAVRVVKPEAPPAAAPEPPVDEPMAAVPAVVAEPVAAEPAPAPARPAPPARQVRVLRPTAAALNAGIRPGERAPAPPPAPSTLRTRERATRGRVEYTGTPGETATPQTTYIPPPDAGRRRSRRGSTRGGKRAGDGRTGRLDRDFTPPPDHRTLEERIAGRIQQTGDLKPIRLVEGSTVKEFAEKLGIKPKEIVGLLLQRGVFATINQALDDNVAADLG